MLYAGENLDADTCIQEDDGWCHRITIRGQCLTYQQRSGCPSRRRPGRRGACQGMSQASRFAMLKKVSGVNWQDAGHCHFLTLTYPDHYYGLSCEQLSLHRSMFWRSLENGYGKQISALWRTEHKVRKSGKWENHLMPHLHVISFKENNVFNADVNDAWSRAIGSNEYVNTDVRKMKHAKQVGYYVAKYAAKADSVLGIASNLSRIPPGRAWGILRRNLFPQHEMLEIRSTFSAELERYTEESLAPRPPVNQWGNRGFTLLGGQAVTLWNRILLDGLANGETIW